MVDVIARAFQGRTRAVLDKGIYMRNIVRRDLQDRRHEAFVACDISDAPPIHGIGFREREHTERTLEHARQRGNADVFVAVIDDLLVDLVGGDQQIMLDRKCGQRTQFVAREHTAGRICRVNQ